MKYYAMFYDAGAWDADRKEWSNAPRRACGDRSCINIDGRLSTRAIHAVAADTAKKRGYVGYHIERGATLGSATRVTPMILVRDRSDLQTVSELLHARRESGRIGRMIEYKNVKKAAQ